MLAHRAVKRASAQQLFENAKRDQPVLSVGFTGEFRNGSLETLCEITFFFHSNFVDSSNKTSQKNLCAIKP